jgi:hypothetical protein
MGEAIAGLARGELSLAELADLSNEELAEILQFAAAQMKVGKNAEAARVLKALVALEEANPVFHEYLGLALERCDDLDGALSEYDINIDQLNTLGDAGDRLFEAYLLRARLNLKRGDTGRAAADLEQSRSHDAGHDPVLTQELERLAMAMDRSGR